MGRNQVDDVNDAETVHDENIQATLRNKGVLRNLSLNNHLYEYILEKDQCTQVFIIIIHNYNIYKHDSSTPHLNALVVLYTQLETPVYNVC